MRSLIDDDYFNKVKTLYHEISELDHNVNIFEFKMRRIVMHGLNLTIINDLLLSYKVD